MPTMLSGYTCCAAWGWKDENYLCYNFSMKGTAMKIIVDQEKCRGSRECIKTCPQKAITLVNGKAVIDPAKCDGDGICIAACPNSAIQPED
jgi:heterodisulfide reductase subunit A-like polyferredoxin